MQIHGKTIFITGGAGFIGSKLCGLLAENNKIILYDNLHRNSISNTPFLNHPNVKLVIGDVLDKCALSEAITGSDIIIHLAAIAGIDTVIKSPTRTMNINIVGIHNLLEAICPIINRIERFVFFSTSEVFGAMSFKQNESHATNLQPVGEARWTYAVSKLAGEHMVNAYHKEFGLRSVIIRPFNIYGPGQVGEGAIHVFVEKAICNNDIQIHGDGDQIRSWCYIDDLLAAVMLILQSEVAIGNIFNIGNPRGTITVKNLAEKIVQLAHSSSKIVHVPKNYVDVDLRMPCIDKARDMLGYKPNVDLDEGVLHTIEWYRKIAHAQPFITVA